jgi:imidazole glycerol-phosphate synthase subunit HisF
MLKKRVIPILTIKNSRLVKSINFDNHRNIGSYISAVRVFNSRNVDELIFIDIDARENGLKFSLLREITKECFMPVTIGGGIKTLEDMEKVFKSGADKVSINTEAVENPRFIKSAAKKFGNQSIVISIDARKTDGQYKVFICNGKKNTGLDPVEWAKKVEKLGAGEIILTSIDKDGIMNGYDYDLVKNVSKSIDIPIIVSGGAGSLSDFYEVMKSGLISGVGAGSIFQYTQITPKNIKEYLAGFGVPTRL